MIDFGLSKDFSGQETMKTMSGSVSTQTLLQIESNLNLCEFSHTTSPQKFSCKTTTLKLTSGRLVLYFISCSQAKFPSLAILSSKSLEMWSKATFILITSPSRDTPHRRKNSCSVWLRRKLIKGLLPSKLSTIRGFRKLEITPPSQLAQNRLTQWERLSNKLIWEKLSFPTSVKRSLKRTY